MKRIATLMLILFCTVSIVTAQESKHNNNRRRFSPQEYQEQQKTFITEQAKLTPQEAEAFFPLYFDLQKKKWAINKEARGNARFKRGETPSEEQCVTMVNDFADAKVKIAQLEKEYIALYLKVIPAQKIMMIQHAEERFQREMLRKAWNGKNRRKEQKKD